MGLLNSYTRCQCDMCNPERTLVRNILLKDAWLIMDWETWGAGYPAMYITKAHLRMGKWRSK